MRVRAIPVTQNIMRSGARQMASSCKGLFAACAFRAGVRSHSYFDKPCLSFAIAGHTVVQMDPSAMFLRNLREKGLRPIWCA